jgi:lipopolysaccharide transport system ATP-binding protein
LYFENKNFFKATLKIKKWPLVQGSYYLNAYIRDRQLLLDHIKECIWVDVESGDYYKTGKLPSWKKGVYIDYEWK